MGQAVGLGDEGWLPLTTLLRGIQLCLLRESWRHGRHLTAQVTSVTSVTELDPTTFHLLRSQMGVTTHLYQQTLGLHKLLQSLLVGALRPPRELTSSGRSGSYFFTSSDGWLVIKSLPDSETSTLLHMAKAYLEHLQRFPDSLLVLFLGAYQLHNRQTGHRTNFVIMPSIFPPDSAVQVVYDLKGSKHARTTPVAERRNRLVALKDLDLQHSLELVDGVAVAQQVDMDSRFLAGQGVMDYSLLVGIADVSTTRSQRMPWCRRRFSGGLQSSHSPATELHIGVIDILTQYTSKRAIESSVKQLLYDNASALPPAEYQARFARFVQAKLVPRRRHLVSRPSPSPPPWPVPQSAAPPWVAVPTAGYPYGGAWPGYL